MISIRCFVIIFVVLAKGKGDLVQKTIYIDTTGGKYYQIIPINWFVKTRRINIRVQALYDASFALLKETDDKNPLFEIVLGAEENTKSYIKKNKKIVATADTPGVLDPFSYKGFWISWYTNSKYLDLKTVFMVRIGEDGDDSPFMSTWHSDPGPSATAYYIGVRTDPKSGSGFWEIDVMYNETNITTSTKEITTKSIPQSEPDYETFYPILNQRLEFKVKIQQDAWIILSKNPSKIVDTYYQIILGGWGNTKCVIMTDDKKIVAHQECAGALHSEHYRGFWIQLDYVENTLIILVGNDGEILPFMKYIDFTGVIPIYYSVACTGKDRIGYWIIKVSPPTLYKYVKTEETYPATYFNFDPIPESGVITIKTKATRDAWIGLTSSHTNDPDFEIIIGGWNNCWSSIRQKGKDFRTNRELRELDDGTHFAGFWIRIRREELFFYDTHLRHLYIHVELGREAKKEPFIRYRYKMNSSHPIEPKFYSIASTLDTEYVEWILEASVLRVDTPMPKYYITYDNPKKYHLYMLEGQRVEFDIKTAQNAIICLTTSSHKPYIEISLDNGKTNIFKDGLHKATFDTHIKMNNEMYQAFWIDWKYSTKPKKDLCLRFGREKENIALLEWHDTEPFLIKFIGVDTRNGIGHWKFYDSWLEPEPETLMPKLIRTYNNPNMYQFFPIVDSPIRFRVKAGRDANLAFTTHAKKSKPIVEVLLGAFGEGWYSQYTYIRKDFQRAFPGEIYIKTPNILRDDTFVGFWINWEYIEDYSSGLEPKLKMELGLEGEEALLSWESPELFPINYVGVTGYKSNPIWMFEDDIEIIEKTKWKEVVTKDRENYKFFPLETKPLWLQVKALFSVHVALASAKTETAFPVLECMIGVEHNTKTMMRFNKNEFTKSSEYTEGILSNSLYETIWFDWEDYKEENGELKMAVYIGRGGDHNHFAHLIIDPFEIHFFGIKSIGNTAYWQFTEVAQSLPPYVNTYNHSNQYQFYVAPNHTLIFYIKAVSDAYIALATTNSSTETSTYEIMIGTENNQKSLIRKGKNIVVASGEEQLPVAKTEHILSSTDFRGFWMDWVYYLMPPLLKKQSLEIRVGRQGEVHPFLRYHDNNSLPIKFIGFTSGYDKALWRFEEVTEDILPDDNINVVSIESKAYDYTPDNYTLLTTSNLTYQIFSLPAQKMSFEVKTHSDVYIALLSRPQIYSLFPMIEILIGGRNQKSWIKKSNGNPQIIVNTPLVLKVSEFRGFWVSWVDGNIAVGFMDKNEAFMSWTDPKPFTVNFIGVTTKYSAIWRIIDTTIQINDDKFHVFPIAADKTMFQLKGSENARIILTNSSKPIDPIIEIILGAKSNSQITFQREGLFHNKKFGGVLDKNNFRGYWISWTFGKFTVGLKGEPHPIAFFDDPTPVSPNYIFIAGNKFTTTSWLFKVAPAWKPVQWDNHDDNPCFLDPNGQECKDRTIALEIIKNGRPEDRDKRLVNDCDSERWKNAFQCKNTG